MMVFEVKVDTSALKRLIARLEGAKSGKDLVDALEDHEAEQAVACKRCGRPIDDDDQRCRGIGQQPICVP